MLFKNVRATKDYFGVEEPKGTRQLNAIHDPCLSPGLYKNQDAIKNIIGVIGKV